MKARPAETCNMHNTNPIPVMVGVVAIVVSVAALACVDDPPPPSPTATPEPTATALPDVAFGMSAESVMAPLEVGFDVDSPSADASYTWDFGDGASATGASVSHTYLDAGQFQAVLRADFNGVERTAERAITVQPGVAGWIVPNSASVELQSGEAFEFEAEAYDELGNPVDASAVVWSSDPDAGTIDQDGSFVAGREIGTWNAGVVATFERGGVTVAEDIQVSVVYGTPSVLFIDPPEINTRVTWEFDLTAKVLDDAGHELEDADIAWEVLRPGDQISGSGEYIPGTEVAESGSALVVARFDDGDTSLREVVYGEVAPGILDQVAVMPALEPLAPGSSVQLTTTGYDRFGNEVELERTTWKLNEEEVGSVTPGGLLTVGETARQFGEESLEVRGFKDGIESVTFLTIDVQAGLPATMEFRNRDDSVPAGAASPLIVDVRDRYGNLVTDADVQFGVRGGGYLAVSDVFVAGLDPGLYVESITATLMLPDGSDPSTIETTASVFVRERSSDFLAIDVEDVSGSTVYLINLITAQLVPVSRDYLNDDVNESMPAWMPDGNRLLLTSDITGENQIHLVDPFHNVKHQITDVPGGALMAAPSPTGDRLAFVRPSNGAGGWDVVVAPLQFDDRGAPVALITLDDVAVISSSSERRNILPHWSPDGEWLMYTEVGDSNNASAFILSADDPTADQGFEVRGVSGLAWHPSGEEVLVTSSRLVASGRIVSVPLMVSLTSGEPRELDVNDMGVAVASFSPDGTELAFVDEESGVLWLMDFDGTGLRQAVGAQFQTTITSWRPRVLELPTDDARVQPLPNEVFSRAELAVAIEGTSPVARIVTDAGTLTVELYAEVAPKAVANFVYLAVNGYYDGLAFHTIDGGAAYSGSITDGAGGMAGYYIISELNPNALHDRPGVLSMVASRAGAVSSEFVVSLQPNPEWDGFVNGQRRNCDTFGSDCYVVFGQVTSGLELISSWDAITPFDVDSEPHRILDVLVTLEGGDILGVRQ